MQIRKTTLADIDTVAAIYDRARIFMCEQGNPRSGLENTPMPTRHVPMLRMA